MTEETITPPAFTQERLDAARSRKLAYADLNPTERAQLDEYQKTGSMPEVNTDDAVTTDAPTLETPVNEVPENDELKAIKTKLFDSQVEANRNKQLLEKQASDTAFYKKQLEDGKNATITPRTEDNFDDDSQKNLIERLTLLESQATARAQRDLDYSATQQTATESVRKDLEVQKGQLSVQQLQNSFPNLKTTEPVHMLDAELNRFSKEVGGLENVNKYLEDPEFKKQKDSEGVAPLSDSFMNNLDKFNEIVELNNNFAVARDGSGQTFKDRNADMSLESFYMQNLHSTGKYNEMLNNAKLAGANKVVDKIASQKFTATTMTPAGGADVPSEGMTPTTALEIMKRVKPMIARGEKLTEQDRADYEKYLEFAKSQYSR